ncbi:MULTISPECIES: flavodoxin family protein [unclassified Streptomyces]|uniref:flavodoxin family protein n=1 Tax=unclassified Streptomyces TaxID=2593676 RepID=UPI000DAC156D|nr:MULTISPECIES: flavodoxin family protein [unclassified Streptomyces]PZT74836.1 NAD(P)H dehydrogenase [Streptomyces sp. AC1-42T]PZT82180.1 NAD(P)H dehydrogenase [Streptomyces sp. AC1-42W]
MVKIAVVHYSSTGNVHKLAVAAAEAAEKEGAEVRLLRIPALPRDTVVPGTEEAVAAQTAAARSVPEVTLDDLLWADGILLGSPVRFGMPAAPVSAFIDSTAPVSIPGELADKVVSAFTSGSAPHGGHETTLMALYNAVCHWGSLIVATGSTGEVLYRPENGNPYGSSSVTRNRPGNVHEDNLEAVRFQTRRVVVVAETLARGRTTCG